MKQQHQFTRMKEETRDDDSNTNQHKHHNYNDNMKLSLNDVQQKIDFNIVGTLWFATKMTHYLMEQQQHHKYDNRRMIHQADVVKILSLAALYPFPTMAIYSTCKALGNVQHQALAMEMKKDNDENDIASNDDHHDYDKKTAIIPYQYQQQPINIII